MSNKVKKKTIWDHLNRIIPLGVGLAVGYSMYWNVINPIVEKPAKDTSDWV